LSAADLENFGSRIPFLLGGLIAPVAPQHETPAFRSAPAHSRRARTRTHPR
jgi:hypothetical protein